MKSVVFPQNERVTGPGFDALVTAGVPASAPDALADLYVAAGLASYAPGSSATSGGSAPAPVAVSASPDVAAEASRAEAAEASLLTKIAAVVTASGSTIGTITPTGTGQAGAALLSYAINVILTVPPGTAVELPPPPEQLVVVINKDPANALPVYPSAAAQIDVAGINLPVQILPGSTAIFSSTSPTQEYSE